MVSVHTTILNWNGTADTLCCLRSLFSADLTGIQLTAHVIDNGSDIDPEAVLKEAFPLVQYSRFPTNQGFASAANVGLSSALSRRCDFALLLNNDAVLSESCLEKMIAAFGTSRRLGIVCPSILSHIPPDAVEFAGGTISYSLGTFAPITDVTEQSVRICDYVSGACMLVRHEVISSVGLLDERFFAYFEDTDYCIRARDAGWDVGCCTVAVAYHLGSRSTRRELQTGTTSPLKHYLVVRNRMLLIRKHASLPQTVFFVTIVQPVIVCFLLFGFLLRGRGRKMKAVILATIAGLGLRGGPPPRL